jgi:glycosyltransferase involved in cell wall biosynthesis
MIGNRATFLEPQHMINLNAMSPSFPKHLAVDPLLGRPIGKRKGLDVALIGNSLPRRCGIATFTTDLQQSLSRSPRGSKTSIFAMTDRGQHYDYPPSVEFSIPDAESRGYVAAARYLNAGAVDVVSLQHEFGIFGGPDGDYILKIVDALCLPLVTTFHTILASPTPGQQHVIERIAMGSSRVVVMAAKGARLLAERYDVDRRKIAVIPHGIPDVPKVCAETVKVRLGLAGRTVILTFGLLSPNKGIEVMLEGLPTVLRTARRRRSGAMATRLRGACPTCRMAHASPKKPRRKPASH